MKSVEGCLIAEGTSDQVLLRIIEWVARQKLPEIDFRVSFFRTEYEAHRPTTVAEKVACAIRYPEYDVLFIHRDADASGVEERLGEIERSVPTGTAYVPIVPLRMTEAWLLFNEDAIRRAVGRPTGTASLEIPRMRHVERISDPKELLRKALQVASGGTRRHREKISYSSSVHRIADFTEDWSPLRELEAFRAFEARMVCVVSEVSTTKCPDAPKR